MYLIPLFGHTAGHCGVAFKNGNGWHLHVADAASFADDAPTWMVKFVLGPHQPRLKAFVDAHPEVRMTMGHMDLKFFEKGGVLRLFGALERVYQMKNTPDIHITLSGP